MNDKILLHMENIRKSFLGTEVLKGVQFQLCAGEIVSLVGTNGAGKSTLSNIIMGIYSKDEGIMQINGKEVQFTNPKEAELCGVGMVHQEPTLVNNMRVYENIFLNNEIMKGKFLLDREKMKQESRKILDFIGFDIDPMEKVVNLSLVQKEVIEIAKAMLLNPQILILDEVTAPLNQSEVEHLFQIIEDLKKKEIGIIFIGHKIKELTQISDRIVVIRDGCNAGELDNRKKQIAEREIIHMMLGETDGWQEEYDRGTEKPKVCDEVLLAINGYTKQGMFNNININVHQGEIVGLAGLKGSGITELLMSVYGAVPPDNGQLVMGGKKIVSESPHDAIQNGIGMITNDRQKENIAMTQSVKENIVISSLDKLMNSWHLLKSGDAKIVTRDYIDKLSIKTTGENQQIQFLSGGNQQKAVVAKWLFRDMKVLLIDEPTRGVDVKAKKEIYNLLIEQKKKGKGILVTSPEIRELLNISDRILIIANGRITGEIKSNEIEFNEAELLEKVHSSH